MSKTIEEQVEEFDHFLQNSGNEVSWGAIDKKMTAILQERDRIARNEAIKEERERINKEFERLAQWTENAIETPEGLIDGSFYTIYRGHWEQTIKLLPRADITSDKTDV